MVFFMIKLFFFDSQLRLRPYQKQTIFFLSDKTQNNFFHHLFHLILCTPCQVLEVSPQLPGFFSMFFYKESYFMEYEDQNC